MIDWLISAIVTAIGWVRGGLSSIANYFSLIADYAADILVVGEYLSAFFAGISAFFDTLADSVGTFGYYVQNALNAIDVGLDQAAALVGEVYGWISDKLHDAYSWATAAWDWIVDTGQELWNAVYGWISDKLHDAYGWATDAWDWIKDTGQNLWSEVHGWIADKLQDAYDWATNALEWIVDFPSHLAPFLDDLKAAILSPIAPFINLISFFFDDINAFFSDPLGFILSRLTRIVKRHMQLLLDIADKIGDALFGG